MLMTLAFAGAAALMVLMLYSSTQLTNTKTKLQNTADAVAYSGAVLEARDHNYSAYINRAMVTNQVAIAQLIGMRSFILDAQDQLARANGVGLASVVGQAAANPLAASSWAAQVQSLTQAVNTADAGASAVQVSSSVQSLHELIDACMNAQDLHHEMTEQVIAIESRMLTQENDPQATLSSAFIGHRSYVSTLGAWHDYTRRRLANAVASDPVVDPTQVEDRFADLAVSALDAFSINRTSSLPGPTLGAMANGFAGVGACTGATIAELSFGWSHGGGTQLSADKKHWRAIDASQGSGFITCWYPPAGGSGTGLTVTTPLTDPSLDGLGQGGSGGAVEGGSDPGYQGEMNGHTTQASNQGYGQTLYNPALADPAGRRLQAGTRGSLNTGLGGLQPYYRDLANVAATPANQTAEANSAAGGEFTVEIERLMPTVQTAAQLFPASQSLKLTEGAMGGAMRTLASAHAYFLRPTSDALMTLAGWQRSDGKTEYANLFNPYWQARLVDTPAALRQDSCTAQNGGSAC